MVEVFREHWATIFAGPVIEGAAWEIRFTSPPSVPMLDGYLTVDTGAWYFHLYHGRVRGSSLAPRDTRQALGEEGLSDERGGHWRILQDHDLSFYAVLFRFPPTAPFK